MKQMKFNGFAPETFDFLWGIRMNNNRDWFLEHKQDYVNYLYEPMKALGAAVYEPFAGTPGMVCKVSRIYRDMRMPQPNGPYKESLWISLRPDAFYWGEHPCLYFEIRPEQANYGFVNWRPNPAVLEAYRKDLEKNPTRFPEVVAQCEAATGMVLSGEEYKKRRPTENSALEPFMSRRSFLMEHPIAPGEEPFTPELADRVARDLHSLLPIYDYFLSIE